MKFRYLFLLMVFFFNTASADFTNASVSSHPILPNDFPFVIDIRGEWPTDCHPGEQKPVIREYDGDSVLIEFETIVERVTCNQVATPYRVLVDMSDVVGSVTPQGNGTDIDVTVRFDGAELRASLLLSCALLSPCPVNPGPGIRPEAGLYGSDGLEKQGLLLARQNQRMAAYPLIYDDSGSSEWLFGGGGIVEDVYFTELYELTGGQCLGCPPPDEPPELNIVGKLTLLMDSQGLVQMKINDGLFTTYQQSEFGYGSRNVGGSPDRRIPDLSGRWAFVENVESPPQATASDTSVLPLVFDITLESVTVEDSPTFTGPPISPGNIKFAVRDKEGNEVAQMQCDYDYDSDWDDVYDVEVVCDVKNLDINAGSTLYAVKPLSVERLSFEWVGPIIPEIGASTRIAVRID